MAATNSHCYPHFTGKETTEALGGEVLTPKITASKRRVRRAVDKPTTQTL